MRTMKIVWKTGTGDHLVAWEIGARTAHVHAYEVTLEQIPILVTAAYARCLAAQHWPGFEVAGQTGLSAWTEVSALYVAKFGAPTAGDRIFVRSQQMETGWQDNAIVYTGLVPASS
jgi:hypothetical protein